MKNVQKSPGDLETIKNSHVLLLDLSENRLTPKSLRNIGPNVRSLNVSHNPLNSCTLPYLEKLRTLFLDNCNLISIARLPSYPELRKLSIMNNKLKDFKGLPYFPRLEYLDIRGNPIEKCPLYLTVAAFGSIYIKMINKNNIPTDVLRKAFEMSPLVGYALRQGRAPISYGNIKNELKESQDFLIRDTLKYMEEHHLDVNPRLVANETDEGHILHCPFPADAVKWYKHQAPENGSEWKEIRSERKSNIPQQQKSPRTSAKSSPRQSGKSSPRNKNIPKYASNGENPSLLHITMDIRLHLIRCDFIIGKKRYPLYTDYPLGRARHEYSLPFPVYPTIEGTPIEGSLINCLELPIPAKVAWAREGTTIAKETNHIILSSKEVNQAVACVMQPYCKFDKLIAFSTIFTSTEPVHPIYPIISGLSFPETVMEESTIRFKRVMFPDREGKSTVTIEKAFSPSGFWVHVETLNLNKMKYKPKGTDVGYYLRVCYTPVTTDGIKGETCYFYSQARVLASEPKFKNTFIAGVPKTQYPLCAVADYSGGIPGNCTCDWFFSKRPINPKLVQTNRLQKVAINTQYFTPSEEMADGYLAVLMTPVRNDDVYGKPSFYAMESPILLDDAPKPFDVPKEAIVGKRMRFPCVCDILLSKPTGFCGFDFLKSSSTFTPREKHAGRILRVVNETGDMIIGEIKNATPIILTVRITSDKWQVSHVANIEVTHKMCKPENLEILWLRIGPGYEKAVAINTPKYVIQPEDASFQIQAVVTPFDEEHHKKKPFFSDLSPIIKLDNYSEPIIIGDLVENETITINANKEFVNVVWYHYTSKNQFHQVGEGITYEITKQDVGKFLRAKVTLRSGVVVYTATKGTVLPSTPKVSITLPKTVVEGDIIKPEISYQGHVIGKGCQEWYRETDDGWEYVTDTPNYKVTALDVDCIIKLIYYTKRSSDVISEKVIQECGPVDPLPPTVKDVKLFQNKNGNLEATGKYTGGIEGKSFIIWRYYDHKNKAVNYGKTIEKEIPPQNFAGKTVEIVYVPIRFDGAAGNPVQSNKIVVEPLPKVEFAEILVKRGRVISGNLMRCNVKLSKDSTEALYQWHHGDGKAWEIIEGATEADYRPTDDDVGFYMLCSVIAVNKKGWKSPSYAATTLIPLEPADPVLNIISPAEKVLAGMILTVNLKISSKRKLLWQRESTEDQWENISFEEEYIVTCNDLNHRIRAITSDGLTSEPTNPIELEPILTLYVKAMLRTSSLKFIGLPKLGPVIWTVTASQYGVTMDTSSGNKKKSRWRFVQAEAVDGTVDEMVLWMDPSSKFIMIPTFSNDPRLQNLIKPGQIRDYVVSVLLGIKHSCEK